jgi:hypothetical protein
MAVSINAGTEKRPDCFVHGQVLASHAEANLAQISITDLNPTPCAQSHGSRTSFSAPGHSR